MPLPAPVSDLLDLVLPSACPGCGGPGQLCHSCHAQLAVPPTRAAPDPVPDGLPPCLAIGEYTGVLRDLVLAYKERGRRGLARPLGAALAPAAAWLAQGGPVLLTPVPSTRAAIRSRWMDHTALLARSAAATLRSAGYEAGVSRLLRALPRPDSAGLSATERATAAAAAYQLRAGPGTARPPGPVVLLDDVLTTGSTLAAVAHRLRSVDIEICGAIVLAATRRRRGVIGEAQAETP
ncbi:ComF family protein [Longispora albida]|uniref:ComF family protein n=1 Tax=Longispora albida TaxID=203523 RepID=UPI00035DCF68|nr:phosphoribosyltransferase family protein [Longispora albida]